LVALPLNDVDEKELKGQLREAGIQDSDEIFSVLENVEAIRSARSGDEKYGYPAKHMADAEKVESIQQVRGIQDVESIQPVIGIQEVESIQPVIGIQEVESIQPVRGIQEVESIQPVTNIEEIENILSLDPGVVDRFMASEGLSWNGKTRWHPYSDGTKGVSVNYGNRGLFGSKNMDYPYSEGTRGVSVNYGNRGLFGSKTMDYADVQRILDLFDINDLSQIIRVIPIKNIVALERLGFSKDRIENIIQSARIQEGERIQPGRWQDVGSIRPAKIQDISSIRPARIQEVESIRPAKIQDVSSIRPARIQEVESIRPAKIQGVSSIRPARIQEAESIRPVINSHEIHYKGYLNDPAEQENVQSGRVDEPIAYTITKSSKLRILQLLRDIDEETKVLDHLKNQLRICMLKLKSIQALSQQHLSRYQNLLNRLDVLLSRLKGSSTTFEVYDSVPNNVIEEGGKDDEDVYGNGIIDMGIFGNTYNVQEVDNMSEVVSKKEIADLLKVTGMQEIDLVEQIEEMTPVKSIQEVKRMLPLTDQQADRLLAMARAQSIKY